MNKFKNLRIPEIFSTSFLRRMFGESGVLSWRGLRSWRVRFDRSRSHMTRSVLVFRCVVSEQNRYNRREEPTRMTKAFVRVTFVVKTLIFRVRQFSFSRRRQHRSSEMYKVLWIILWSYTVFKACETNSSPSLITLMKWMIDGFLIMWP